MLDALPDSRFRGRISRMVPTVDRAKATVMTKVKFDEIDPRVLPEMSAKVSFLVAGRHAEQQKPLVAVNADALGAARRPHRGVRRARRQGGRGAGDAGDKIGERDRDHRRGEERARRRSRSRPPDARQRRRSVKVAAK